MKRILYTALALAVISTAAFADDGVLQIRDVSKTPDWETHHATIKQLPLYVPAQMSGGELLTIVYEPVIDDIGDFVLERNYARPLVALYEDGPVEHPEDSAAFYGHGERDYYGAVSLDDGATWKRTNLSESADRSSIKVDRKWYPGDVFRNFATSAGNKVLGVWASRYCNSGDPTYSMEVSEIANIFDSDLVDVSNLGEMDACTDDDADRVGPDDEPTLCPYFEDYWHVAGSQGVKDFAEEEFPTVGKVPYACLWTARGTLELLADGTHGVVWRKAERLTSGVRDVHRMEAACVPGAGCVVTWQEDPEGLRPGKGEGPGEGWSGAIAHHETDIWYSFIDWDNFDLVMDGDTIVPLIEYTQDGRPKAAVPLSMPMRLTDNAMCTVPDEGENADDPYCYIDLDASGTSDNCATDVMYDIVTPEGPTMTVQMCVAEDGRLMRGNTASTRARTNLRGYDSDNDGITESAWVVLAYEESKGLGEEDDLEPEKIDMGKNIWYHTFDMFNPEFVSQGLMLNQPAIYPRDVELGTLTGYSLVPVDASGYTDYEAGGDFMIIDPDPIYSVVGLDTTTLYQTEIARRYSQITQPASKAGDSGTVALAMYKQGIVRQGGPADVFGRRFVLPDGFDETTDNPFDYANIECDSWLFEDGSNPRYVKGLCLSTPQNLSGTTLVNCEADSVAECEAADFPYDDLFSDIDKSDQPGGLPKMTEWRQCQADGQTFTVASSGGEVASVTCDDSDLNDQSWENPWDLSKGHRGFMKGDFIMQMYAWSPNWEANVSGHDNYNLYVRRSFDGGVSWTTLPADYTAELPEGVEVEADGTTTCEWFGAPGLDEFAACFDYVAGEYEQARNLSQLIGSVDTVLDPRYAPTSGTITADMIDGVIVDDGAILYPDDVTDPSKYFATFEIGDATDAALGGEAVPMDMFYARAINFGDDYEMADTNADGIANIDPNETEDFEIFDKLEWHDPHAAEATLTANPGGTLFYTIWNEWMETEFEEVYDSDATVRRTMELGDLPVTTPTGGDGDGGEPPDDPPGNKGGRN